MLSAMIQLCCLGRDFAKHIMYFNALNQIKTIYMGSPEISKIVLEGLLEAGLDVVAVISNEDRPLGRKAILTPTPVKAFALTKGIPVYTPHRIKNEHDFLQNIPCDLILTMAYGQIVPVEVLNHPKYGCLNLHGSLLPALRGAAPIQRALDLGLTKTGVTLMEMVDKMDAGRMYDKQEISIEEEDNYTSLSLKIASASIEVSKRSLLDVLNKVNLGVEQDETLVSIAKKITAEEEHLDLTLPMKDILNHIRALSLTPGAYCYLDNEKIKILKAKKFSDEVTLAVGAILPIKKHLVIQLSDGQMEILRLLPQGKKEMDGVSFLNGHSLEGKVLK